MKTLSPPTHHGIARLPNCNGYVQAKLIDHLSRTNPCVAYWATDAQVFVSIYQLDDNDWVCYFVECASVFDYSPSIAPFRSKQEAMKRLVYHTQRWSRQNRNFKLIS